MLDHIEFIKKHYSNQIETLNYFINDAYPNLPIQDTSQVRFGGGTALAIYYFQHRLSFDVDLFVQDPQFIAYLSPKHWIEDSQTFGDQEYIDFANHIRVLSSKSKIKLDVLVAQDNLANCLVDDSKKIFTTTIHVESIEDIIAKKIVHRRASNFTRDIIDIGIAIEKENILEKLLKIEAISKQDISELNTALDNLDRKKFNSELEVVKPFDEYLELAQNSPDIIQKECKKILPFELAKKI